MRQPMGHIGLDQLFMDRNENQLISHLTREAPVDSDPVWGKPAQVIWGAGRARRAPRGIHADHGN